MVSFCLFFLKLYYNVYITKLKMGNRLSEETKWRSQYLSIDFSVIPRVFLVYLTVWLYCSVYCYQWEPDNYIIDYQ